MAELDTPVAEQREVVNAEGKVLRDFSILSEDIGLNENYKAPTPTAEETAAVTETPEEKAAKLLETEATAKAEKETFDAKVKELGLPETATKEEVEIAEKAKSEKALLEEEGFTKKEEVENLGKPSENGWVEWAKDRGYGELKEDTEEAANALEKSYWEGKIEEAKAEVSEEKFLSKYSPETRARLELLNSGMTEEQINAPFQQIEKFKAMDGAQLVRASIELEHPNWSKEVVDKEMEILANDGKVEHEEQKIRIQLDEMATEIKNDFSNRVAKYKEEQGKVSEVQKQKELSTIKTALDKVPEFIGKKVTETDKQYLLNKLSNGYLETLKNNPDKLIKAAMFDEWGEKGLEYYKANVLSKITTEAAKKQANVPTVDAQSSATKAVVTNTGEKVGPLDMFKDFLNK